MPWRWSKPACREYTDSQYADGVRWAQKHCNKHGITGVLDARVEERHMRVYRQLERDEAT